MSNIAELASQLQGASRMGRQQAAKELAALAREDVHSVADIADTLIDALNVPEAQTRWEVLGILTLLVDENPTLCEKALDAADEALFDEENGIVRLAAMRFMCKIGALSKAYSVRVWPLIDDAIQCYHGDLEFQDMLGAVVDFSAGDLDSDVKTQLANRMAFDAANTKGPLVRRAQQIIANVS